MISFSTRILKFSKQGEKTGWTYVEISARQAHQLKPDCKVSFRVKGKLDQHAIRQVAIMPMGEGNFILPLNATMRKAIGKKEGEKLNVELSVDEREIVLSPDLIRCLKDEPALLKVFKGLPGSHQKYYSRWIESAKTSQTKAKRIALALQSFAQKQSFSEMIRANKGKG
jgi:Domain of unknown function (DUF1905)/Bacteriocin-protection, YdeI or OmpD-Associated